MKSRNVLITSILWKLIKSLRTALHRHRAVARGKPRADYRDQSAQAAAEVMASLRAFAYATSPWILRDMPAKEKITIEIPYGYTQRDQLLQLLESKFPGVEISLIHTKVGKPEVGETLTEYDSSARSATAKPAQDEDARTVMDEVEEALSQFANSAKSSSG